MGTARTGGGSREEARAASAVSFHDSSTSRSSGYCFQNKVQSRGAHLWVWLLHPGSRRRGRARRARDLLLEVPRLEWKKKSPLLRSQWVHHWPQPWGADTWGKGSADALALEPQKQDERAHSVSTLHAQAHHAPSRGSTPRNTSARGRVLGRQKATVSVPSPGLEATDEGEE